MILKKKINWLLQENLTKPTVLEQIKRALNGVDESWETIQIIPFSTSLPPLQNPQAFNIVYGSTTFMLNAYQNSDYRRGVFYDPAVFQMQNYVRQWDSHVLNHQGKLLTFGNIHTLESHPDQKWFVRPNHDSKEFGGRLLSYQELLEWSQRIIPLQLSHLNQDTEIWVASPQNIDKEWRLFIVEDNIVSACRYQEKGVLSINRFDVPAALLDFVEARIQAYHLYPVYVLDVALVSGIYKIIECNCFNGTGFYDHEVEKVVGAINGLVRSI